MGLAPAPGAEEGDVQLVAGRIGSEEPGPRQDEPGGSGEGDGLEEVASFHGASLATGKRVVKQRSSGLSTPGAERIDGEVEVLGFPALHSPLDNPLSQSYCNLYGSLAISE